MDDKELYNFVAGVSGDAFLKVEESFGDGFVRLRISEAERRQAQHDIRSVEDIVIEMLRNARDAHAKHIFVSSTRDGDDRALTFIDDGDGVPANMHDKIFEPRVTSKLDTMVVDEWGVHGRGMALYSIKSNVENAHVYASDSDLGASIGMTIDTTALTERKDQSTWPKLEKDEEGTRSIAGGPHNIIRRVLEFALENRDLEVFLGSPADIVATLYAFGKHEASATEYLFCDDLSTLPLCKRLAGCADSADLVNQAAALGLPVSERTAHRVLGGTIRPLSPALSRLTGYRPAKKRESTTPDIYKDRRGLKLASSDVDEFARELESAFEVIGSRYYLGLKDLPKITVNKDKIRVTFEVEKED